MSNTNREAQLEKIEQAEKKLLAKKQRITNIIKTDKRKAETRMKILLGSILLKGASEDEPARQEIKTMVSLLSERDQKAFSVLFESWNQNNLPEDACSNSAHVY